MAFVYRGVIEGFYGRPWSRQERLEMLAWMGKKGFNAYFYAPKDDELHRRLWREPYPPEAMTRFAELVEAGRRSGVRFWLAISPGLSLTYSDPAEFDRLWAKLLPFIDLGVTGFGLFFDDIPPQLVREADRQRYPSLAAAQAEFSNRLWARLKQAAPGPGAQGRFTLIVCPTHYCGDPSVRYLKELGESLDPQIELFWTGPQVCSRVITREHCEQVQQAMHRPPLIWDNYPVNDGMMAPELHIGPYTGRDRDLGQAVRGIFANPMNQALASKLPLACIARYMADPAGYDPQAVWREEAAELLGLGGSGGASGAPGTAGVAAAAGTAEAAGAFGIARAELMDAFEAFAGCQSISHLAPQEPEALTALFGRFEELLNDFRLKEAGELLAAGIARLTGAAAVLGREAARNPFLADMRPWLQDFQRWVGLLGTGLELLGSAGGLAGKGPEGREAFRQARERLRQGLKESVDWPTRTCGDVVRVFLQRVHRFAMTREA